VSTAFSESEERQARSRLDPGIHEVEPSHRVREVRRREALKTAEERGVESRRERQDAKTELSQRHEAARRSVRRTEACHPERSEGSILRTW